MRELERSSPTPAAARGAAWFGAAPSGSASFGPAVSAATPSGAAAPAAASSSAGATGGAKAPAITRLGVVGRGRLGGSLVGALDAAPFAVLGPLGRDAALEDCDAVLLCVPDGAIAAAAAQVPRGPLVGHCSGALGLGPLAPHEAFSLHPLMTFPTRSDAQRFAGAGAAVAGSTPRALATAEALGAALGLETFTLADADRGAYHAAASIASNFLVTLEAAAERVATGTGLRREQLVPLVRATVESWSRLGPAGALTGPIARGDEATVQRQREAVADRAPELVALFDALVEATRSLAAETRSEAI